MWPVGAEAYRRMAGRGRGRRLAWLSGCRCVVHGMGRLCLLSGLRVIPISVRATFRRARRRMSELGPGLAGYVISRECDSIRGSEPLERGRLFARSPQLLRSRERRREQPRFADAGHPAVLSEQTLMDRSDASATH